MAEPRETLNQFVFVYLQGTHDRLHFTSELEGRGFLPKCLIYICLTFFRPLHFSPKDGACEFAERRHNLNPKEEASYLRTFPKNLKYLSQHSKEEKVCKDLGSSHVTLPGYVTLKQ